MNTTTEPITADETFVMVESPRWDWHDTYVIEDVSADLTEAMSAQIHRLINEDFDNGSCGRGDDCVKPGGAPIGYGLYGDADEFTRWSLVFVSDKRMICEECAEEILDVTEVPENEDDGIFRVLPGKV